MADPGEDEDYDLKDEELVDFEGSDYGFESAEEEETVVAPDAPLIATAPAPALVPEGGEVVDVKDGQGDGVVVQPLVVFVVDHPPEHKFPPNPDLEDGELDDAAMVIILIPSPYLHAITLSIYPPRHWPSFLVPVALWARVSYLCVLPLSHSAAF
jgi:hypothetical protein